MTEPVTKLKHNRPTFFLLALVFTVIVLLNYFTVKIYEQAARRGMMSSSRFLEYGSLIGKGLLVLIVLFWIIYLAASCISHYRTLNRNYSELQKSLVDTKDEVNRVYFAALNTLTAALQARDGASLQHLERVARYAVALGKKVELPSKNLVDVYCAALLHDFGKIGIPENILNKPGSLTSEEFAEVRKHPEIGTQILKTLIQSENVSSIILHHHEFYNGAGYPSGLAKDEIPLGARIIAVVEAYDAMISNRPYRKAMTHEEAVAELVRCAGVQFDPCIVMHFLEIVEQEQEGVQILPEENYLEDISYDIYDIPHVIN